MNYLTLHGKSSSMNIGKTLRYLKNQNVESISGFAKVSGSSAKAWEQGFSGDKLSRNWSRNSSIQRVLLVSSRPQSLRDTYSGSTVSVS